MSRKLIEQLRHVRTFNKGFWVSAKIYNDQKTPCPCGGSFTGKEIFKKVIEYPVCIKCGDEPKLFRIRAKVIDTNMVEKYIDVRHFQGERLKDIVDVFTALKQVDAEILNGTFDLRKYDTKESRESYLFDNFVESYLVFQRNKVLAGKLKPTSLRNKITALNHLKDFFKGRDLSSIKVFDQELFSNSFKSGPRALTLALNELTCVLGHAVKREMIHKIPDFEKTKSSNKRTTLVDLDVAAGIIEAVENPRYKTMLRLLHIYPVRPCELRALKWSHVDYFGEEVSFETHFSGDKIFEGRKSIDKGDKSSVVLPLVPFFKDFLLSLPRPINSDAYIFTGTRQDFVSDRCLSRAWRKASEKIKAPKHDLYEMRGARLTKMAEQSNGNIIQLLRVSGHTNPKTLTERYIRDRSDIRSLFV